MPVIDITGLSEGMRLDSAVAYAFKQSTLWDSLSGNDNSAIGVYHDILTYNYTQQELSEDRNQFMIEYAYHGMKNVVSHAISDSTITIGQNQSSFSTPIQQYVDVLNALTEEDTIQSNQYIKRFYLELDKASLFRMLGNTSMGLNILQNVDLCPLDSMEQVAMNQWKFAFEEEVAKQQIGTSAYGKDTVYTDTSSYHSPTSIQINETYFGSVINGPNSVSYRTCSFGNKAPEQDNSVSNIHPFKLYPNPSQGQIVIEYEMPLKSSAEFVVYGITGQVIYRSTIPGGNHVWNINISDAQSGIYLYELWVNDVRTESGKIFISN
jgi:hypothetical protein